MWSVDSYQIIKILITRCENIKVKILKIQIQSSCCLYWLKYRSLDSQEINKNSCHQMSYFKAKMHQIQNRLGPDPAGGAYSAPQTL